MGAWSGVARGLTRKREGAWELTGAGQQELFDMLAVGCSISECADYLTIDEKELQALLDDGGDYSELRRAATGQFRKEVRQAQLVLSKENATMAKHLGAHALGQPKDPTPKDDSDPTASIIGTMPDYDADTEAWLEKFAPKGDSGGSTIAKLQKMRAQAEAKEEADNAVDGPTDLDEEGDWTAEGDEPVAD